MTHWIIQIYSLNSPYSLANAFTTAGVGVGIIDCTNAALN
jgi:hypothetical protein